MASCDGAGYTWFRLLDPVPARPAASGRDVPQPITAEFQKEESCAQESRQRVNFIGEDSEDFYPRTRRVETVSRLVGGWVGSPLG
jgi:hypothetical protein